MSFVKDWLNFKVGCIILVKLLSNILYIDFCFCEIYILLLMWFWKEMNMDRVNCI